MTEGAAAAGGTSAPLRWSQNKAWASRPHGSAFVSLANYNNLPEMKTAWLSNTIQRDKNILKINLADFYEINLALNWPHLDGG